MSGVENLLLDTNVLVYCYDHNEMVKAPKAQALVASIFSSGQPLLSTQVLSEFYWTVTRKIRLPLTHDEAVNEGKRFLTLARVVPMTVAILEKSFQAIDKYGMPLWDAQVFATATLHGAAYVLSEDFQHRLTLEGVTFLNPFSADFELTAIIGS